MNANGAAAVSQSVVDVKHRLSMLNGAFLLYVESAVPLFALALKVHRASLAACAPGLHRIHLEHHARAGRGI